MPSARVILAAAGLFAALVRVAYVIALPDLDGDAYGHFHIAGVVARHPTHLAVHWVWLPGHHFALAALRALGVGMTGARLGNALLQTAGPFLLAAYAQAGDARARPPRSLSREAYFAALAWTSCALPNVEGTTALSEVPFTLLVLGAALALDRERAFAAGLLLAAAATLRYEAWVMTGAVLALALARLALRGRRPALALAPAVGPPLAFILVWIVLRRGADGEWAWFLRETHRFTAMQRGVDAHSAIFVALWLPVLAPLSVFGPAIGFVVAGASRPRRVSAALPLAVAAFLAYTYARGGLLGHLRYLSVLAPFACVLLGRGLARAERRFPRAPALAFASLAIAAAGHLAWVGHLAAADAAHLEAMRSWAESP